MSSHFEDITYLERGNDRQRFTWQLLTRYTILDKLQPFDPLVVGTIPIDIDIERSDVDIICHVKDAGSFRQLLMSEFGAFDSFSVRETYDTSLPAIVAAFNIEGLPFEIFGQNIPSKEQYAWRHMLIEHKLLQEKGETFRQRIIELKKQGHKTEPAFAIALGITGDPYMALLNLPDNSPSI
jgi:hypothetical protein